VSKRKEEENSLKSSKESDDEKKVILKGEKREFTRCKLCLGVEVILSTGVRIDGQTEDISMSGLLFTTERGLPIGTEVKIHLFLHGDEQKYNTLNLRGVVVRVDERGVAIKFNEMDSDSVEHLKRLLTYNIGKDKELERLDDEFDKHLGIKKRIE